VATYDVHQHLWPESLVEALAERAAANGITIVRVYGSTEHPSVTGSAFDDPADKRHATDGAPLRHSGSTCSTTRKPSLRGRITRVRAPRSAERGRLLAPRWAVSRRVSPARSSPRTTWPTSTASPPARRPPAARALRLFIRVRSAACGAPARWASTIDYTAQMQRAYGRWLAHGVERWPDLRTCSRSSPEVRRSSSSAAQARGFDITNALHPTIFLDTSSYGRRALEFCLATFGARQIVFGSDAPVIDSTITLAHVRSFGQAAVQALCHDNPTILLT
jgi:hypothetical protein